MAKKKRNKATVEQKAAFADRTKELYERFVLGSVSQQAVLDGLQELSEDRFGIVACHLKPISSDWSIPRKILGKNFISPEEITKAYSKLRYSDELIERLKVSLPSEEDLNWLKANNYGLMPAPANLNVPAGNSEFGCQTVLF